jgi:spore coat polysaccharide biosynthesis protein SpsF
MNVAIVQARMNSTRLPGKVLKNIYDDLNLLDLLIKRLKLSEKIDKIVVGCTTDEADVEILDFCITNNIICFNIGNPNESIDTVYNVSKEITRLTKKSISIIDITADCPLIDPFMIDEMLERFIYEKYDYLSNCMVRSYPRGFDIQIYNSKLLDLANEIVINPNHRQHSGWNIWAYSADIQSIFGMEKKCKFGNILASSIYFHPEWRLCIDYPEDLELIEKIIDHFGKNNIQNISYDKIINYLIMNPKLLEINKNCKQKIAGAK